jgi:hypothetical protein
MKTMFGKVACIGLLALASATYAVAGSVLIVTGSSGTSEPDTTFAVYTNLQTLHEAVGNTVTLSSDIPVDLSSYSQVWDIRFSPVFALTAAQQAEYLAYLQAGGGMFIMGENSGFMDRNNSILSLITAAGGGTLTFNGNLAQTQDVIAPFTGPNTVTQVTYAASGGVDGKGTGDWITQVSGQNQGSGVAFGKGDLANAELGALTVIFDVNFMQNGYYLPGSQDLTKNLIGFVQGEVEGVPDSASTAFALLFGLAGLAFCKRRIS